VGQTKMCPTLAPHTYIQELIDRVNSLPLDFARTTHFLNACHESLNFKHAPFLKAPIADFLRRDFGHGYRKQSRTSN